MSLSETLARAQWLTLGSVSQEAQFELFEEQDAATLKQSPCAMGCAASFLTFVLIVASDAAELEPRKGKGKGDVSWLYSG